MTVLGSFRRSGSRVSIHNRVTTLCLGHCSLLVNPMPPRTTRKSYRPRVSDRTMVGLIATTLLAGARMPAGATSNMKRKIPRDAADRIAVAGPERDVRNLVPFLRMEKCFFLTSPFIEPGFFAAEPPKSFLGSLPPPGARGCAVLFSTVTRTSDEQYRPQSNRMCMRSARRSM